MNKQNLLKLADYIQHNVTQEMFDMENYRPGGIEVDRSGQPIVSKCGTVGCALGWSPFVPGLEVSSKEVVKLKTGRDYILFRKYSERIFDLDEDGDKDSNEWNFLFDSDWVGLDNTPRGFVRRVHALIDGLDVSDSFFDCGDMNFDECEALKEIYDREYAHIN